MKPLKSPYIKGMARENMQAISNRLDELERHAIGQVLWTEPAFKPEVLFSIAYSDDSILLKYFVEEKTLRVACNADNSPVYQDSCVEFFISFNEGAAYYNLEFNSIGYCIAGYGPSRTGRQPIPTEVLSRIKRQTRLESQIENGDIRIHWTITLLIPFEVFINDKISSLQGRDCKANFFKGGEALPEPHFLSWQFIRSATPNFHLPEFFGSIQFI